MRQKLIVKIRKASFWERLLAMTLDLLLFALVRVMIILLLDIPSTFSEASFFFLCCCYSILTEYYFQATLGKMLVGLKVIGSDRRRADLWGLISRNVGKIVSALPFYYGYFRILAPHRLQTMHDEIGNCMVVKVVSKRTVFR